MAYQSTGTSSDRFMGMETCVLIRFIYFYANGLGFLCAYEGDFVSVLSTLRKTVVAANPARSGLFMLDAYNHALIWQSADIHKICVKICGESKYMTCNQL